MTKSAKIVTGVILAIFALGYFTQAKRVRSMLSRLGDKFANLHPRVQTAALNVIDELAQQGIFVGIPNTGGWRDVSAQLKEINEGDSTVNDPLDSYHSWGLAVDFAPINAAGNFYWPDKTDPVWKKIGDAIKNNGGEWGGDWFSIFDGPHGQWRFMLTSQLKRSFGTPLAYIEHERKKVMSA